MQKKSFAIIMATMLMLLGQILPQTLQTALASASIPAATTVNVSSDSKTGASVALPALIVTEGAAADVAIGTYTWALPAGFVLDTTSSTDVVYAGAGLTGSGTVSYVDSTHFSINVTATSTAPGSITIGATNPIKVRVANGSPLAATGKITLSSGSVSGISSSSAFVNLTQVPGTAAKLSFSQQPPATLTASTTLFNTSVAVQDQFGNLVSSDNNRAINLMPSVISSSPLGAISGQININTASGVASFTNLSYNQTGIIQLVAQSSGLTAATSNAITVSASTVTPTPIPTNVDLPNGVLVKFPGDNTIYLVINGSLRPFTSAAIFNARGKKFRDVKEIGKDWFKHFRVGRPVGDSDDDNIPTPIVTITLPSTTPISNISSSTLAGLPNGTVVKVAGNPTVYLVTNGQLQPIPSINVFRSWRKNFNEIKEIPASVLNTLPLGSPATFADGTLLKGSGHTIYVVKGGQLYGIPNMGVLAKNGWSLNSVLQVQAQDLTTLTTGGIAD